MGLDIALVGGGGLEAALDHLIGFRKAGRRIAVAEFGMAGDVGGHAGGHVFQRPAFLHDRRTGLHRRVDIGDMRQDLVVHPDELQRRLGGRRVDGGDGGDGVAVVKRLAPRHAVFLHVAQEVIPRPREVVAGHDRLHALQRQRRAGVDGPDPRMGMGAAQDATHEHSRHGHVRAVKRTARDLVDPVGAIGPRPDLLELALLIFVERHVTPPACLPQRPEPHG